MRKIFYPLVVLTVVAAILFPSATASAAGPQWVVVNWGDTLYQIAGRYGTTVSALMNANNLPNADFVYAGQRLIIPSGDYNPAATPSAPATSSGYYTVRYGDTLYLIAARYGTNVYALAQANGLSNWNFIYPGQQLRIPGLSSGSSATTPAQSPASNPAPSSAIAGKWIDVNIGNQTVTAYEGSTAIKTVTVSTGVAIHPTVTGTYHIYAKFAAYTMSGGKPGVDYYYLPNVPWTMFWYQGYAIHGTYWHHNFGHPMSHGCVNLRTEDAKWFYDWAPVGTTVVSHN